MIGSLAAAAALLLALSGVAKLRSPGPAAGMVLTLLPRRRRSRIPMLRAVRAMAAGEVAVGAAYLAVGGRLTAALLAAVYLLFAVVAVRLLAAGDNASCGCFGAEDSPISAAHVVLDLAAAAAAVAAVIVPVGALAGLGRHDFGIAAVGAAQVALLAWLSYLAITALPALTAARRLEDAR